MKRRAARRLRLLALRTRRAVWRHYVTLISAVVITAAAGAILTSASFELTGRTPPTDPDVAPASIVPDVGPPPPAFALAAKPRRQAIIYLVVDETQGNNLVETHGNLIWDNHLTEDYQTMAVDYLVASSPETESDAIRELNYYIEMKAMRHVDLRVIDLRPGRGLAANTGAP